MDNSDLYSGSGLNLSGAAMPQFKPMVLQDETAPLRERAAATRSEALGKMEQQAVALLDAKTQSDADSQALDVQSWMEQRMAKGLAAVPGTAESWFFADGTQDQDKIASYLTESRERMAAIRPQFISAVAAEEWSQNQQRRFNEISTRLQGQANLHEAKAIRASAQELLDKYEANGDTAAYIRQVGLMQRGGVISAAKADTLVFQARKRSALDALGAMVISDPDAAYDALHGGAYDEFLSGYDKQKMLASLRKNREEKGPAEFAQSFLSVGAPDGGADRDGAPEMTGYFSEQECRWLCALRAGRADDVRVEMTRAMLEEARAFDPNQDEEEFRAAFARKWNGVFGFDKDFVSRQLALAGKRREKLGNYAIDVKQRLDNMETGGMLFNAATWQGIESGAEDVSAIRTRYGAALGVDDDTDDETVRRKYLAYRRKGHAAELRGRITERYDAWLDTDEGSKASPVVQREKLLSIAREVTGNKRIGVGEALFLDADARSAMQAQQVRHAEWAKKQGKLFYVRPASDGVEPYALATVGFDASNKTLPEGVLLPEAMVKGRRMEDMVVEMTYDNKHVRRFRVVGTTDGDAPVMTYAVARKGGYSTDKAYNVALRVRNGNTEALMQPFERPLGAAVPQSAEDMILESEARRDRRGRLMVYYPSAHDGGVYEVAGINQASHPAMAARLKQLVDSGQHEEAERQARAYIRQFTEPVAATLSGAGVQSKGADAFLRSVFFNGGEGGACAVLNRVLGTGGKRLDDAHRAKLREYMKTHSEKQFLEALRQARSAWYRSIVQHNPRKQVYAQGWENRTEREYRQAVSMD